MAMVMTMGGCVNGLFLLLLAYLFGRLPLSCLFVCLVVCKSVCSDGDRDHGHDGCGDDDGGDGGGDDDGGGDHGGGHGGGGGDGGGDDVTRDTEAHPKTLNSNKYVVERPALKLNNPNPKP